MMGLIYEDLKKIATTFPKIVTWLTEDSYPEDLDMINFLIHLFIRLYKYIYIYI